MIAQADRTTIGRIFDLQKFSLHDGPGIRTIVFLKGCVLRCRWCCNPESQRFEVEQMTSGGKTRTIGQDVTVAEVMDVLLQDLPYYRRSGGGVTLSGGESLCQPDFAVALLHACKEEGLHTAMESAASVPFDTIARYLPYLDLYLLDIKHMDSAKHEAFTSKPNALMLENARKIAEQAREVIIRVPVVPTFNDTPGEIAAIARFAKSLPGVKQLHLLPYHRLGQDKYEGLGRTYAMANIEPPSQETMQRLLQVVQAEGLQGQIGG